MLGLAWAIPAEAGETPGSFSNFQCPVNSWKQAMVEPCRFPPNMLWDRQ